MNLRNRAAVAVIAAALLAGGSTAAIADDELLPEPPPVIVVDPPPVDTLEPPVEPPVVEPEPTCTVVSREMRIIPRPRSRAVNYRARLVTATTTLCGDKYATTIRVRRLSNLGSVVRFR